MVSDWIIMEIQCDNETCFEEAVWTVYAAYDTDKLSVDVHPHLARYPMPMIRACNNHVIDLLMKDTKHQASTKQWVIKPVLKREENDENTRRPPENRL